MSSWNNIKDLDKTFSWSFFGFLLGIIGIAFTVYTIYFQEKKPIIELELLTNTNVLDVKEEINKLDIIYDSVSIKKTKRNLRMITVKIQNVGNENLTQNYYDSKSPLGFEIRNADLIQKPQIIEFSNDYFKEQITLDVDSLNRIFLPPVIIDKGEFFSVKILSLVKEDISPEIIPKGYLSGIGTPKLKISLNDEIEGKEEGFWRELISGNLLVHFVRFFLYLIGMMIFMLLLFIPFIELSEKRDRNKRKRKVQKFQSTTKLESDSLDKRVFSYYVSNDESYLHRVKKVIENKEKIKDFKQYFELRDKLVEVDNELMLVRYGATIYENEEYRKRLIASRTEGIIRKMISDEVVQIENETLIVDSKFEKTLDEFIYFLRIQ